METKFEAKLESLIASSGNFNNADIKAALDAAKKKKAEKTGEMLLSLLGNHEKVVSNHVEALRLLRQQEREMKKRLAKVVKARDLFEKTGEIHALIFINVSERYSNYQYQCNQIGLPPMSDVDISKLVASL